MPKAPVLVPNPRQHIAIDGTVLANMRITGHGGYPVDLFDTELELTVGDTFQAGEYLVTVIDTDGK